MVGNRITQRKSKESNDSKCMPALSLSRLKSPSRRHSRILEEAWKDLIKLKKQSLGRKIAALEEDKGRIVEIFEHINQAREQLVVRICVIVVISYFIASPICLAGDRSQSP